MGGFHFINDIQDSRIINNDIEDSRIISNIQDPQFFYHPINNDIWYSHCWEVFQELTLCFKNLRYVSRTCAMFQELSSSWNLLMKNIYELFGRNMSFHDHCLSDSL